MYGVTLIPPQTYEDMVGEPDLMFANGVLYGFIALCVLAIFFGYWLFNAIAAPITAKHPPPPSRPWLYLRASRYIAMPLLLALAALVLYMQYR